MKTHIKIQNTVRWIARISGSLILAFFLFFLIAHIFGNDESGQGFRSASELISFILFPMSTIIGLSIALKWEGLGGLITILGMTGFFILRPDLLTDFYIIIPILPGVLYSIYWLMSKKQVHISPNDVQ